MNKLLRNALAIAGLAVATQAVAQITFYEHGNFEGRSFTTDKMVGNFVRVGFNDRASSVVVVGERWEVCEDVRFNGRCIVLRPGSYPSLDRMGMNDRISSARMVGRGAQVADERYAPPAMPGYDYNRRRDEQLYEANVVSVHAVVGPPEQRCWIEHEKVVQEQRGNANVPGAVAGALIGGILGHQVGSGRGNDLATAGGAVAGAAIGANAGRDSGGRSVSTQDVKRCENVASQGPPEFWDVAYSFRGVEHHVQMRSAPGPTITVNGRGEPRS